MSDLRERVWDVVQSAVDFASDASLEDNTNEGNACTDAVLAVFAEWLRQYARVAWVVADGAPDDDLTGTALWGGASAVLTALADEIDRQAA